MIYNKHCNITKKVKNSPFWLDIETFCYIRNKSIFKKYSNIKTTSANYVKSLDVFGSIAIPKPDSVCAYGDVVRVKPCLCP